MQSPILVDSDENRPVAVLPEPVLPVIPVVPVTLVPLIPVSPAPVVDPLNSQRIMGVIPDFQTVRDPNAAFVPLTPKQKWSLAFKENIDPVQHRQRVHGRGFFADGQPDAEIR